jgi:hypothetical protein
MTGIPPFERAQAYATPVLLTWRGMLIGARTLGPRGKQQLAAIKTELARRQGGAIPTKP